MKISVAICTHNRFDHLGPCLDSLKSQSAPQSSFEVLVVDNGSNQDDRDLFLKNFELAKNCRFTSLAEPGLSKARNYALREAATPRLAFIDDDARASENWVQGMIDAFDRQESPKIAFGPIEPIWPDNNRPSWLPPGFVSFFAVLDLGTESRAASQTEYGFGANVAFDVETALEAGGFNESVGRIGRNLLSNEEIVIQNNMRAHGATSWYNPNALVTHYVHEDRLRVSWLISRLAWQIVSEKVEGTSYWSVERAIEVLNSSHHKDEVSDFLNTLLSNPHEDHQTTSSQIYTVSALTALLLSLHDLEDWQLKQLAAHGLDGVPTEQEESDEYRWAPPISPHTRIVVAEGEGNNGHPWLIPPLRTIPGVQEVELKLNGFRTPCKDYTGLFETAESQGAPVFLPTIDSHLYWTNRIDFTTAMSKSNALISGILHRLPDNKNDEAALREFGPRLHTVFVLAPALVDVCKERFGLVNVQYLPLVPRYSDMRLDTREALRQQLDIPQDACVFAMTGEQREGKGLNLLLRAMPLISHETKKKIFVLLAGKADENTIKAAQQRLENAGVQHRVDLRDNNDVDNYIVLSELDFAKRIAVSDFGLLLFQKNQRNAMSGAFPDYLNFGARFVATKNSVVGSLVENLGAGFVLEDEKPQALAQLIDNIVATKRVFGNAGEAISKYLESVDPNKIASQIEKAVRL